LMSNIRTHLILFGRGLIADVSSEREYRCHGIRRFDRQQSLHAAAPPEPRGTVDKISVAA